ncbi:phage protein Gp37 [Roseateles sp. DXS20W]|uniref:Phage protein Gp37 n=1 Tax=Pelomonas lactea TaxID=3299030 RepID=A0ABW7GK95_9BURK
MSDIISTVEAHLVDVLTQAVAGAGLRVQDLPGDWDDEMLRTLLTLAPCVLISFSGGQARRGATTAAIDGQWTLYVVTKHPSGQQARRRGNAMAIGAYEVVSRLVVPVLHNHLVPGVGTLSLTGIQDLYTGSVERQGLAVYGCTFVLPMSFEPQASAGLGDFATFVSSLDIPPHASSSTQSEWLQGNFTHGKPDASDTVNLPTS